MAAANNTLGVGGIFWSGEDIDYLGFQCKNIDMAWNLYILLVGGFESGSEKIKLKFDSFYTIKY